MSRKKAIDAYCKECNYDPLDRGNWRQQITACTMINCPLYTYRPISEGKLIEPLKQAGNTDLSAELEASLKESLTKSLEENSK